jgi:hypothetical protein
MPNNLGRDKGRYKVPGIRADKVIRKFLSILFWSAWQCSRQAEECRSRSPRACLVGLLGKAYPIADRGGHA